MYLESAHFGANCVEIRYLHLKIMQFYVFKMAANGGRHFEINIKAENDKLDSIYFSKACKLMHI